MLRSLGETIRADVKRIRFISSKSCTELATVCFQVLPGDLSALHMPVVRKCQANSQWHPLGLSQTAIIGPAPRVGGSLFQASLVCLLYAEQQPVATRGDAAILRELSDKCASRSFVMNLSSVGRSCGERQEFYMLFQWNYNKEEKNVQV